MKQLLNRIMLIAVLFLCCAVAQAQVQQWQEIYKVKKKDTLYGIATRYGITVDELVKANSDGSTTDFVLKKGMKLLIPVHKETTVKPAKAAVEGISTVKVGVMLPLHGNDGDGKRMIEYYRGILMALDSLKHDGFSTEVYAWNVPQNADIRQTLLEENASKCDVIFGPLYTAQVEPLATFCKSYGIKMVIPFSIESNAVETNSQIFRIYQSNAVIESRSVEALIERFPDSHVVIVDGNDSTSHKASFTRQLRKKLEEKGIDYSLTSLSTPSADFAKAFRMGRNNVVVLNTGRSPQLNTLCARLNALVSVNEKLQVTLFGYTEWLMYTKNYRQLFHKYNAYIPTYFYYNAYSSATTAMENAYRRWFHSDMQKALPRFAITGYDHAEFFVRGLHKYGRSFDGTQTVDGPSPIQTQLKFRKIADGGGMQCTSFMLMHYAANNQIEAVIY